MLFASSTTAGGCGDGEEWEDEERAVARVGVIEGAISSSALRSADGTYGAGCGGRAGTSWSLALASGAALQNSALSVAKQKTTCVLTLTHLRTSDPADGSTVGLYAAAAPVALTTAYAGSTFSGSSGSFPARAKLSSTAYASNFTFDVVVGDWSGSSTTKATYAAYSVRVAKDAPVSYWRLGEAAAFTYDDFTGASSAQLQSRSGAVGASWTKLDSVTTSASTHAYISNQGRVRMATDATATYTASSAPTSGNYTVQADLFVKSQLGNDQAYVLGRSSTSAATFYVAGWVAATTAYYGYGSVNRWELGKMVAGTYTPLAFTTNQSLTTNGTYNVVLQMYNTSIQMFVNGSLIGEATDSAVSGTGRPGLMIGKAAPTCFYNCDPAPSDTNGVHLDNLRASYCATDSRGTNHGQYLHGVALGTTGVIAQDTDKAATFDGIDDYVRVDREISDNFSIEFWFKSTQGIGTSSVTQWYNTAGLVDADATGTANDFGVGLRADGRVLAGTGNPDVTIVSSSATAFNNDAWHHVVFTRTRSPSALALYVDGVANGTTAGSTASLTASSVLNFGRHALGNNYFKGSLDDVAIYDKVLDADTVLKHYQAGVR
jgi:hypothetical protein